MSTRRCARAPAGPASRCPARPRSVDGGVLAAIIDIPPHVGYAAVFALIAIVPLVSLAAAAAIIGDNVGFTIGRYGGRRLLLRPGPLHEHRRRVIEYGEPFFE